MSANNEKLNAAMKEAIVLYWDYAARPANIKEFLFESRGLTSTQVDTVMGNLSLAIKRYDSDMSSKQIIQSVIQEG